MKNVSFRNVDITGGFWQERQKLNREVTVHSVYDRFDDTGRIGAFRCDWKEGMPNQPHIFWDSDVAKWMEGAAYLLQKEPDGELQAQVEWLIDRIIENQGADGYFNIFYTVVEPQNRFTDRGCHELYCAGHLMEAAVAYHYATGRDRFLQAMCKYADYIDKVFRIEHSAAFYTPGHEEIELALVKLAEATGEERYLALSKYFIDTRGTVVEGDPWHTHGQDDVRELPEHLKKLGWKYAAQAYNQSHQPVREQRTAEGHAVRAGYLYTAMADIAYKYNDAELLTACKALFRNIVDKRMYITGGIGSASIGEAFTVDYDLPNLTAYSESCAAIAMAFFALRMQQCTVNAEYADVIERILYNGFLSNTSLDGKSFFYVNPLEIQPELLTRNTSVLPADEHFPITQRLEVFGCSCCPPNILRFAASIGDYLYTVDDAANTVYCHQFMASTAKFALNGAEISLTQETDYPNNGRIRFTYHGPDATLAIRVPGWSAQERPADGYARYAVTDGSEIEVCYEMPVQFWEADGRVREDAGRYVVARGPVLFCMEAVDNGAYLRDIRIAEHGHFEVGRDEALGVLKLTCDAFRHDYSKCSALYRPKDDALVPCRVKLIPYYAFANRGETEMLLWTLLA